MDRGSRGSTVTSMPVRYGDVVVLHLVVRLRSGSELENSRDRSSPLRYVAGRPGPVRGLGERLVGHRRGDRGTMVLPPADAFGEYSQELVRSVPSGSLPHGTKAGDRIATRADAGEPKGSVLVKAIESDNVVLDANHPLAGQSLRLEYQILDIERGAGLPS